MRQNDKKLIIKGCYFLDYPGLPDWPEDIYDAFSDVRIDIGYQNEPGVSNYSFLVYTIKNLEADIKNGKDKFIFGRHLLIVEKFDYDLIKKAIESILPEIEKYGYDVT